MWRLLAKNWVRKKLQTDDLSLTCSKYVKTKYKYNMLLDPDTNYKKIKLHVGL